MNGYLCNRGHNADLSLKFDAQFENSNSDARTPTLSD